MPGLDKWADAMPVAATQRMLPAASRAGIRNVKIDMVIVLLAGHDAAPKQAPRGFKAERRAISFPRRFSAAVDRPGKKGLSAWADTGRRSGSCRFPWCRCRE